MACRACLAGPYSTLLMDLEMSEQAISIPAPTPPFYRKIFTLHIATLCITEIRMFVLLRKFDL